MLLFCWLVVLVVDLVEVVVATGVTELLIVDRILAVLVVVVVGLKVDEIGDLLVVVVAVVAEELFA